MTAKQAKKKSAVQDLKPRGLKSGSKEAGAIKGGVHLVDKASPALMQVCAQVKH